MYTANMEIKNGLTEETIIEMGEDIVSREASIRLNKAGRPFGSYKLVPRDDNSCTRCGVEFGSEGELGREFKSSGEMWCTDCVDEMMNSAIPLHA